MPTYSLDKKYRDRFPKVEVLIWINGDPYLEERAVWTVTRKVIDHSVSRGYEPLTSEEIEKLPSDMQITIKGTDYRAEIVASIFSLLDIAPVGCAEISVVDLHLALQQGVKRRFINNTLTHYAKGLGYGFIFFTN